MSFSTAMERSRCLLLPLALLLAMTTFARAGAGEPAGPAAATAPAKAAAMASVKTSVRKGSVKASVGSVQAPGKAPVSEASAKPPVTGKKKLLLFAKNPATWSIVKGGANGKVIYREATGDFTLNAVELNHRSPYALVRLVDAPPRAEIVARGTSDEHGRMELSGNWRTWRNKFWLVSGEDVAGSVGGTGTLRAWRPERYLFEEKPLGIACACPEPDEP
jgi:hypothetical protein